MGSMGKYAPVAGLGLVVVVILIIVATGGKDTPPPADTMVVERAPTQVQPQASPIPPAGAPQGGSNAPMLESLVSGLEAKVASDPGNVNNRLLLAQTYAELGRQDDALKILEELRASATTEPRVNLVSAMVLARTGKPEHLQQGLDLLKGLEDQPGAQVGQVFLQRGRILDKMGQAEQAKQTWQQGLERLPAGDSVRKELEQALAGG